LLALPLSKNPEKVFLDANDALIGEIVRQFNVCDANALWSFVLSDELQALLQRCASRQYVDNQSVRGFCDGRWWEGASSVWCHAGVDRPCDGRRKCEWLHFPNDAASIDDANRPDPENQFMATLLANANNAMGRGVNVGPWLDSRDSMSLVDYAYRVSGYVNKMATALPHMVCRGCGARLRLNYEYPRNSLYARSLNLPALPASVCSCPNAGDGHIHDEGVYIHYCLNCHRIIDSRECRLKDRGSDGYYLCMYCGASKLHRPATVCPSCGNTDLGALGYYRGSMRTEMSCLREGEPSGEVLVVCKARGCKYDARDFASEFEQRSSG
jgi:ribosomal protein L40E